MGSPIEPAVHKQPTTVITTACLQLDAAVLRFSTKLRPFDCTSSMSDNYECSEGKVVPC